MIISPRRQHSPCSLLWASLAQLDEVTRGQGKVIPSRSCRRSLPRSPATVSELMVKSGQRPQERVACALDSRGKPAGPGRDRFASGTGFAADLGKGQRAVRSPAPARIRAGEAELRNARELQFAAKVAALQASADQARRDAGRPPPRSRACRGSLALAQNQVSISSRWRPSTSVPQTDLLEKRREILDLQGRIAAAREQAGQGNGGGPRSPGAGGAGSTRIPSVGATMSAARSRQRSRSTTRPARRPRAGVRSLGRRRRRPMCRSPPSARLHRPARPEDHGSRADGRF